MSFFINLFLLFYILIKTKIFCTLASPNPPKLVSINSADKKLKISADISTTSSSIIEYEFKYQFSNSTEIEKKENTNEIEIQCSEFNGDNILIKYRYKTASETSEYSPNQTFICADVPGIIDLSDVKVIISTNKVIDLSWTPPPTDGGTPILGYVIKIKKDSESDYITIFDEISCPENHVSISKINGNELQYSLYNILIFSVNRVVRLFKSDFLENASNSPAIIVTINNLPYAKNCVLNGTGLDNFTFGKSSVEINLKSYDSNGGAINSSDGVFILHVRDYCEMNANENEFLCERITNETNDKYNENIFKNEEDYIIKIFDDLKDGNYSVEYSVVGNGWLSVIVYQLIQGGLMGQYYNNVWFLDPPQLSKIDLKINFDSIETNNFLSNNLNEKDFISIRWIGAIKSPETNLFTFTISSDDGIRIFINNKNVLDHLNSPCDDDNCSFTYDMSINNYYWIIIEYVQLQGPARIKIFWQTSSKSKEIIPTEFLFYPELVPDSPYSVKVSMDSVEPYNCYVENNEKIAYVGQISKFNIIPVDTNDEIITSISSDNDIFFAISINNKDSTNTKGNLYFKSKLNNTDTSNQNFVAEYIPIVPGEYTVNVKFGDIDIKNSPFDITVKLGKISPIYSFIDDDSFPETQAGNIIKMKLNLYDIMNNKFYQEPENEFVNIKLKAEWVNDQNHQNYLNVSDYSDLENVYAGNYYSNNDGTYTLTISALKVGQYKLHILIKEQEIKNSPFNLKIIPSILDASKCVYEYPPPNFNVKSGDYFSINYQCRDTYGNNIKNSADEINSKEIFLILNENQENEIKVTGIINDIQDYPGCYVIKFNSTISGIYKSKILLNKIKIPSFELNVNPSSTSSLKSYVELVDSKTKYITGEKIKLKIFSLDRYGNLVKSETPEPAFKIFKTRNLNNTPNEYSATFSADGVFYYEDELSITDIYKFNVKLNTDEIVNSPIINIICVPNLPSIKSIINKYPISEITAGNIITSFKIILKDDFDNLINEKGDEKIYLDFIHTENFSITEVYEGNFSTNSDGNYYFDNIVLTKTGNYSVNLKIVDNFGLKAFYYRNVDFYNLIAEKISNYHNSLNLDFYYSQIDKQINFNSQNDFRNDLPFELYSIEWNGYLRSETSEIYTIYLECFGKVILYINNEIAIYYSDKISSNKENYTVNYVNVDLKKNELLPIKLIYIKEKNVILSKIKLEWESDTIEREVIPQKNLYTDIYSTDEKFVNIINAKTDIESLKIITENYNNYCILNTNISIELQIFDIYNNIQYNINDITISGKLINIKNSEIFYNCIIIFENNKLNLQYNIDQEGEYNLEINVTDENGHNRIYNNFNIINCVSTTTKIESIKFKVEGKNLFESIAGEKSEFTVELFDENENHIGNSDSFIFSCKIFSDQENVSPIDITYITNKSDINYGKFVFNYIAYSTDSKYIISTYLNNVLINSTEMILKHSTPSNLNSKYTNLSYTDIIMNNDFYFNITLYDSYSNLINSNISYKIYSIIKGNFGVFKSESITQNENDFSKYELKFNVKKVNETFSGCGIATLYSYILNNGIKINYYDNYFINGKPFKEEIQSKIELNLEENDLLANTYNKLYTSVQYNFYFIPEDNKTYSFVISTNKNNIRLFMDDEIVIDSFNQPLLTQYSYTTKKPLNSNEIYFFRLNIYIQEPVVKINMVYYSDNNISTLKNIDSNNNNVFYSESTMVENKYINLLSYSPPGKITNAFVDKNKLSTENVTFYWEKPSDNGCSSIIKYKIYKNDGNDFTFLANTSDENILTYTDNNNIILNNIYKYKISSVNKLELESDLSDEIICETIKLSSAPINLTIQKSQNFDNDYILEISWESPNDTGVGDTNIPILSYYLDFYDTTTNILPNYENLYIGNDTFYKLNTKSFKLKYGHNYIFKIYCETRIGIGEFSTKNYIFSTKPSKPPTPPKIDLSQTKQGHLEFTFDPVTETNGAPITKYKISINNGTSEQIFDNNLSLRFTSEINDTNTPITVRYLAENENGCSAPSDPSFPMYAATKPDSLEKLEKNIENCVQGTISIKWEKPKNDGGAAILGYKIYLNDEYITVVQPNILKYTFQQYFYKDSKNKICVTAFNIIGESNNFCIKNVDSSGLPGKIQNINLLDYNESSLFISWENPNDDGGQKINKYQLRKNEGNEIGNNMGETIDTIPENSLLYIFNGLSPHKFYSIQIRANNKNGPGPWSDYMTYFTGTAPSEVQEFQYIKELCNKNQIVLTWKPPDDNGGCNIYGYKIYDSYEKLLYDGPKLSFVFDEKFNIQPSYTYIFKIYAYNCAYQSQGKELIAYSAQVPDKMNTVKFLSFNTSSFKIIFDSSVYDGGLPITYFNVYSNGILYHKYSLNDQLLDNDIITIENNTINNGDVFKIQISAENKVGEGEKSDEVEIIISEIPGIPVNFKVFNNDGKFFISWEKNDTTSGDDNIGYKIYLSEFYIENNVLNDYKLIYDTEKQNILYYLMNATKLNLTENKLYHVCLTAYNSVGETQPVYSNFYYGNAPPKPYEFILTEIETGATNDNPITNYTKLQFRFNTNINYLPITNYILYKEITYISDTANITIKQNVNITNVEYANVNNINIMYIKDDSMEIKDEPDNEKTKIYELGDIITYKVKAVNKINEGEWSNPLKVTYSKVPNAPGKITIKRLTKNSLILTWETEEKIPNNIDTLGYVIYLNTKIFFDTSITTIGNEFTLTDLNPGQKYNVKIKAMNNLGEGKFSEELEFIAGLCPSKVLNVRRNYQNLEKDKVNILFDPPEDNGGSVITEYIIYYLSVDGANPTTIETKNIKSQLGYNFNESEKYKQNNNNPESISFKIKAKNGVGENEDDNNVYSFTVGKLPDAPQNFNLNSIVKLNDNNNISEEILCKAYIKWEAGDDDGGSQIYKYSIYISKNNSNEYEILDDDISPSNIGNYLINNLYLGHNYKLQISAYNYIGQSEIYYCSFDTAIKPSVPLNLEITYQEEGKIYLSWTKPLYENGQVLKTYIIHYQNLTDNDSYLVDHKEETGNIFTYYTLNLTKDQNYKIWVTAKTSSHESDKSNIVTGYASNRPIINNSPKEETDKKTNNSTLIKWNDNDNDITSSLNILGYELFIKDLYIYNSEYELIYNGRYIDNVKEKTITNLINGHKYNFIYYAYNIAGKSEMSPVLTITCASKPSEPDGLTLLSINKNAIEVSWDYSDKMNSNLVPLTGFNIYITDMNDTTITNPKTLGSILASTYSLKISQSSNSPGNYEIKDGHTYKLQISALNGIGESDKSENILYVYAGDLPSVPTLTLKTFDQDYCELSWTTNTNTTKYILYNNVNDENIIIYEGADNTFKHENLNKSENYIYSVSGVNQAGESEKSDKIYCTTYPISDPPGPVILVSTNSTTMSVRWTPPEKSYVQITNYNLYIKDSTSNANYSQYHVGSTNLNYDITNGLSSGNLYEFKVTAIDVYGRESDFSIISFFYFATVPNAPENVTVTPISRNAVFCKWDSVPSNIPILHYLIYYKDNSITNSETKVIKVDDTNNNYYVIDELIYGHEYLFFVSAVNQVGEGSKNDGYSVICQYYPSSPDYIKLEKVEEENTDNLENTQNKYAVTLSWKFTKYGDYPENKAITKYKITFHKKDDNNADTDIIYETDDSSLSTTITDSFQKDQEYEIKIISYNNFGYSQIPTTIVKTIILKPGKVDGIGVSSRTKTTLGIEWNNQGNANYYNIYLSNQINGIQNNINRLYSSTNKYLFVNLTPGETLQIQISAVNDIGEGEKSDQKTYKIYGLPESPKNIFIESFSKSNVVIKFSPTNEDGGNPVTNYYLYRSDNRFFINKKKVYIHNVTNTSNLNNIIIQYDDNETSSCKQYYYTVTSQNDLGESEIDSNSTIVYALTISPPSSYEYKLTITKNSNNSFYVNWASIPENNNGGCKNDIIYKLYMKSEEDSSDNFIEIYSGIQLYYIVENLSLWKKFVFKLVVSNSIGEISSNEETSEETGYILQAPKNLKLIERRDRLLNSEETYVKIKWDKIESDSSFIGYNVYYSEFPNIYIEVVGCQQLSFDYDTCEISSKNNSGLVENKYFYFFVSTKNKIAESQKSFPLRVLIGEIPHEPNEKLLLSTNQNDKSITIQIPEIKNSVYGSIPPSRYIIKMNDSIIFNSTNIVHTKYDLKIGEIYSFSYALSNIIYENDNILGEELHFSEIQYIYFSEVPGQVKNLRINTENIPPYADKLNLIWDSVDCENGIPLLHYIIYQKCLDCGSESSETYSYCAPPEKSTKEISYFVENLIPGKKYSFYVLAENIAQEKGQKSNTKAAIVGLIPYQMNLTLVNFTESKVTVGWEKPTNETSGGISTVGLEIIKYNIYKNGFLYDNNISKDETNYVFDYLVKGEECFFQISCINIIGESILSEKLIVTPSTYPSSPLNFKVISQSSNEIILSWNEPFDNGGLSISGYELRAYIITEETISELNETIQGNNFTYNVNETNKGKTFLFKVRAINQFSLNNLDEQKYIWSDEKSGYAMDKPEDVKGLSITVIDRYSGNIYWNLLNPGIEKGYSENVNYKIEVQYDGYKYEINEGFNTSNNNNVTYKFYLPVYGKKYYFRIIAENEVGESYSNYSEGILFNSKPEKMKKLILKNLSTYDRDGNIPFIELSWENDDTNCGIYNELESYLISIEEINDTNDIVEENKIESIEIQKTSLVISSSSNQNRNLTPGKKYKFYIQAKNIRGYSEKSEPLEIFFLEPPGSMEKPTNGTFMKNETGTRIEIDWKWDNVSNFNGGTEIKGFIIRKKLSNINNYEEGDDIDIGIGNTSLTKTPNETTKTDIYSYMIEGLSNGNYYDLKIAAYNEIKDKNKLHYSEELQILCASAPSKIVPFAQSTDNDKLKKNQIYLYWEPPNDNGGLEITDYLIYKVISEGSANTYINIANTTDNYYIIQNVTDSEANYIVKSKNAYGLSENSDTLTAYPGLKPGKICSLRTTSITSEEITIQFDEPNNINDLNCQIQNYIIFINVEGEDQKTVVLENNTKSYTLNLKTLFSSAGDGSRILSEDIKEGTQIIFQVMANNSLGNGELSNKLVTYNCDNPSFPNLDVYNRGANFITFMFTPNEIDQNREKCDIKTFIFYQGNSPKCQGLSHILFCKIDNLTNAANYTFKIEYYNNAGNSNSTEKEFLIGVVPSTISDIKTTFVDRNGTLHISWDYTDENNDNGIFTVYCIYINSTDNSGDSGFSETNNCELNTTDKYYKWEGDNKLNRTGQTVGIKIKAINKIGEGSVSNIYSQVIASKPSPINIDSITDDTKCNSIYLRWGAPDNGNSSILYYFIHNSAGDIINKVKGDEFEFNISSGNFTLGNDYEIGISSQNIIGKSEITYKNISFCDEPRVVSFKAKYLNNYTVLISWNPYSSCEVKEYKIYRKIGNDEYTFIKNLTRYYNNYTDYIYDLLNSSSISFDYMIGISNKKYDSNSTNSILNISNTTQPQSQS